MFKPAPDWVDAFPAEDEVEPRRLPPARPRTRKSPPEQVSRPTQACEPTLRPDPPVFASEPAPEPEPERETATEAEPAARDSPQRSYGIGYGKPPKDSQFKPGQSGNPKGRPKGAKGLNVIVREALGSKLTVRTADGTKKISKIEAVLQKTLEKALKGDARAQFELMKLWRVAVPDTPETDQNGGDHESLTSADLAMLAAFEAQLAQKAGERP